MLKRTGFVLKLAESGNRQSETVRCQRFEQQSFDCAIDAQSAHLPAARPAMLMLVSATHIDRIAAVRAGIMQPHPATAAAANSNTLQQCIAAPRHPMVVCLVAIEIVREPLLVRHELLPIDISWKCIFQANRPILYRHGLGRASLRTRTAADWHASAAAINISACISRVLQNLKDARIARRLPNDVMRRWPGERSYRQQQIGLLKMAHHRLGAAKLAKLRE